MNISSKVHHLHDVWIDHWPEIEERYGKGKDLSIKSLPSLDDKIWGLPKKKLVVVGGRPSQHKSNLMLAMAWDFACAGKKVYFFTLEMTKEDCIERLFCMDNLIDNFLLTTGKIGALQEAEPFKSARDNFTQKVKNSGLVLIELYGKTFAEINHIIETFGDADCVMIDYLQMIKDKQSSKQAIDEYIKDLRNCAVEKNFCAVVASQINRATHEQHKLRYPELHELKGSGAIEEHCDLCFLLHWEFPYTREEASKEKLVLLVAKNRRGRTGKFECKVSPQFCKIEEANESYS